ncbi:MAG: DUF1361 domain-containing protein [Acholeplasmataceae bacterium]|nr:DUF1361 domain-containing protein [Acholeplasmataceae bacterium]
MILATTVIFLTQIILCLIKRKKHKVYLVIAIILWVIFYPNTFYILTDFIHFQNYSFFLNYPNTYTYSISDWLVFGHIVVGALYAMKLGLVAIDHLIIHIKKLKIMIISALFFASSFAIYLGRFIRLNSWEILKIRTLLNAVFHDFDFMISFVLMFFIIHVVAYLLFSKQSIFKVKNQEVL